MSDGLSWLAAALVRREVLSDAVIRAALRRVIAMKLRDEPLSDRAGPRQDVFERGTGPIVGAPPSDPSAVAPEALYYLLLGAHRKFSSAFWDDTTASLDEAEDRMLALTAERADLRDGQHILDLGCGWGSLALWVARRFPHARVTAISNDSRQTAWIDDRIRRDGLAGITVATADVAQYDPPGRFDRIVSVEMFEHMRNWQALLALVARWLEDDGRVFLQMATRRDGARRSLARDRSQWMSAYFFAGGMLPSERLLSEFQDDLVVRDHWRLSGLQYRRTVEAWLANMDRHEPDVMRVLRAASGPEARRRWAGLRLFFLTCAELWGWQAGGEWFVSHDVLTKQR